MSAGVTPVDELVGVFARVSGGLLPERTVMAVLGLLTSAALDSVPLTVGAGLTVSRGDSACVTLAATAPVVEVVDGAQYELDEGPCLTAWRERRIVRVDDLSTERRWPRWTAFASAAGIGSCLSAPLISGDHAIGTVKLYASQPDAFDDHAEGLVWLYAAQAALLVEELMAYRRAGEVTATLRDALRRRDVLNQAKGVVMAQQGGTEKTALGMILETAARDGASAHEVAGRMVRDAARRRG
jgi:GAF domain-containing protein